jgi:NadR type nicotinamide-nucleotide adenylyltransferase
MKELAPFANVIHLAEELPQHPSEHPEFWDLWRASLLRILPARPDFVFASEAYGATLAEVLGAEFVPVDPARTGVPISATAIRTEPMKHWEWIPRCVRPAFVKRVCIFGPESTGKSTLTTELARCFESVAVPEYARTLLEAYPADEHPIDARTIERIARGQIASEEALARSANRVLFCDTDTLTTTIWSDVLLGSCPDWIKKEAAGRRYDLTLLTDVDIPWVADPVRFRPDDRSAFLERCERTLREAGRPYVRVRGSREERLAVARDAVERLLATSSPPAAVEVPTPG